MCKTHKQLPFFFICALFLSAAAFSQTLPCDVGPRTVRAYSLANSNSISLILPENAYRQELRIDRRVYSKRPAEWQNWSEVHAVTNPDLAKLASEYCDTNVNSGVYYEYQIRSVISSYECNSKTAIGYWDYQYISTGTKVPFQDQRGKVILLVESGLADSLAPEIARLHDDIVLDGYQVFPHNVPAAEVTAAEWKTGVAAVKALIRGDYNTDTNADWSIFIVGHVPIPYSGLSSPGSHTENLGAHPADWYYADLDEHLWTDTTVSNTTATALAPDTGPYTWNWNIPGDGKFDQSFVPSPPELRIGRVDLRNMPAFGKTEVQLMRQYLDRNHAWRHKQFTARDRGLVIPAGIPFENHSLYSSFFGSVTNTDIGLWLTSATNAANSYLFAASKGSGTFTKDNMLGSTTNFAATQLYAVFTTMHGSYYGNWDSAMHPNVVILAPLATEGYVLSTYYHEQVMNFDFSAMGAPIGEELYTMAVNSYVPESVLFNIHKRYNQFARVVNGNTFGTVERPRNYTTLMGDPTLRTRVAAPPQNVAVNAADPDNIITWGAASDTNIQGYHVYRAPSTNRNAYTRLTDSPIRAVSYTDSGTAAGSYQYMVRTVKLEESPSRSFFNASQGVLAIAKPLLKVNATSSPNEGRVLGISGEPGRQYTIEYATSLSDATDWKLLTTITLSDPEGAGSVDLTDTEQLIFYRVKE